MEGKREIIFTDAEKQHPHSSLVQDGEIDQRRIQLEQQWEGIQPQRPRCRPSLDTGEGGRGGGPQTADSSYQVEEKFFYSRVLIDPLKWL